jgi:alpha-2-macroglobulin-like protein
MTRRWISLGLALTIGCASWSTNQLFAKPKTEKEPNRTAKSQSAGAERLLTEKLGGTDRYLTFVNTDKPMYRGGEKVYIRGVILNAANHKPVPDGTQTTASIQIKGPKGEVIATGNALAEDSVWGFAWDVPAEQSGGEYTASVTYPWDGLTPAERKFDVRSYRAPRLKSQITFLRDGYGPGDKVTATLDVKRAEGGVPEGAKITVIARVDGTEIKGTSTNLDDKGLSTVTFDLPRNIPRGEGTLSLAIEDGGVVETASKTIPILLQTVDLQMYPEGGDLIAGFKNRVYLQANQPNGKPADLSGKLMWKKDSQTGMVTNFRTEHEGRGRFEFTPETDKEYFLSISEPTGIKTTYPLPDTKIKGAVISSSQNVFRKGRPVEVQVGCTDKKYHVTLSKREVEVATDIEMTSQPGGKRGRELQNISFNVPPNIDGVLAVTVWDENDIPLAERLIFREPAKAINVSITTDKPTFIPGEPAKLNVKTTNSDGQPVSSVVGLTVTDDTVLELVEKREQAPHLPVMVFLEPEVQDLADASVYLDAANPKAPMMTDLLLGTQGWRRFAFVDVDKFIAEKGDAAKRVVALNLTPVQSSRRNTAMFNGRMGAKGAAMNMGAGAGLGVGAPNMGSKIGAIAGGSDGQPQRKRGMHQHMRQTESGQGFRNGPMMQDLNLPEEIGRIEGPRDVNLFQVEPTVLDERRYTSGRSERHQKAGPANGFGLPFGLPNSQDNEAFDTRSKILLRNSAVALHGYNIADSARPEAVLVREYAHKVREGRQSSDRIDFDETLYWNAGVKTDAKTGEATVEFGLNDSVTTFRVFADAFAGSGAVGTADKGIESVQPFYADAKMPLEVTSGDKI